MYIFKFVGGYERYWPRYDSRQSKNDKIGPAQIHVFVLDKAY